MTELAVFGICVVIVLVLLLVLGLFFGPTLLLFIGIFPVVISEAITGERGTFSPNGGGKHSSLFKLLTAFFVSIQVLLVAAVVYGIHRLINGLTPTETEAIISRTILTPLQIYHLRMVNGVLWLLSVALVLMLLVNAFRFRQQIKLMTKPVVFFGYILPLLMVPIAFLFLASSQNYLTHYPNGDGYLGFFSKAAAVLYGTYLVGSQIWTIYTYVTVLRQHAIGLGFQYWVSMSLGLIHHVLFIYFLFAIFLSL